MPPFLNKDTHTFLPHIHGDWWNGLIESPLKIFFSLRRDQTRRATNAITERCGIESLDGQRSRDSDGL